MNENELKGIEKNFGTIKIVSEYHDKSNIFDFVTFEDEEGDVYHYNLSSGQQLESLDTTELIEK